MYIVFFLQKLTDVTNQVIQVSYILIDCTLECKKTRLIITLVI